MQRPINILRIAYSISNKKQLRISYSIPNKKQYKHNLGLTIKQLLEEQFSGQTLDISPEEIYNSAQASIARKYRGQDWEDVAHNLIEYLIKSKHDFSKSTDDINTAFSYFLNNLRTRAITESRNNQTRSKYLSPEPEPDEKGFDAEDLEQVLDSEVDVRKFYKILRDELVDFKRKLSFSHRKLFELIFEQNVGSFSTDIKENMGQATAFKEYLQSDDDPMGAAVIDRYSKRWSGFVSDTRKELLKKLIEYFEYEVSGPRMDVIYDQWH